VNSPTTRCTMPAEAKRPGKGQSAPFAALPHDIASDPRLSPTDVRVLLALLYWSRQKSICWPSDPSIAARTGRSVSTVQRSLRKLQAFGLIDRKQVTDNPTGRVIILVYRQCETPVAPVSEPPAARVTDEGIKKERNQERPGGGSGNEESPPPPAGDKLGDAPATADDLARFRAWAAGSDPVLARFGRSALKLAGVGCPAEVVNMGPTHVVEPGLPTAPVVSSVEVMPSAAPDHLRDAAKLMTIPRPARLKGASGTPMPCRSPALPSRGQSHRQSPRQLLEGLLDQCRAPSPLEVRVTPRL
jgi:hypothetical protein